jgi:aspartate dehydrogenase
MGETTEARVAIIGLGNIGGGVLAMLERTPVPGLTVVAACDQVEPAPPVRGLLDRLGIPTVVSPDLLLPFRPTHVAEAAGVDAVREWALFFLERSVSFVAMSAGGLTDPGLASRIHAASSTGPARLIVPSGAVGGLDVVRAAARGDLGRVHLRTVKPAGSLAQGEMAREGPVTLFRGSAAEGAMRFPRNINVAMTLAMAGLGPERTTVEIVADPAATVNSHHVTVEGDFGTAEILLRNLPSPGNPRTSHLAVLSLVDTLRRLAPGPLVGG